MVGGHFNSTQVSLRQRLNILLKHQYVLELILKLRPADTYIYIYALPCCAVQCELFLAKWQPYIQILANFSESDVQLKPITVAYTS